MFVKRITSAVGATALLVTTACQPVPTGPTASEGMYNAMVAQCNAQGGKDRRGEDACQQANAMANQVSYERSIQGQQAAAVSQNNAVAAGVAAGAAGLLGGALIGGALSGPRHYHGYGYRGYGGRRW
jgi:hypothetical protein